ncbi:Enzyme that catalyzes the fourth step in the histidine pathway [Quaeritorhiza haematococci]|nr:Enzyme that catalyzes the fourth step in the histidine pathway [Quaeritorhiza haematococci]
MTLFKPCIDLHEGQVKQIVGGSLTDKDPAALTTNFVSSNPPSYYANLYRTHSLHGAHVIKLGPNNDIAAKEALSAWPHHLQIGGGITIDNALQWLDEYGAGKVIVTSWLFPGGEFDEDRLRRLSETVGTERLVVDVSEFLVHAADVEGLCQGIDADLVRALGEWTPSKMVACTYAGGANSIEDLQTVHDLSKGRVDLTFGSALDIFGGRSVKFMDAVAWNQKQTQS